MFIPLAVETVLQNRYRIVGSLGRGAMGAVYLAQDSRLKCEVAIKQTMLADEDDFLRAFEREALLLANLSHSGLPRVSDYFTEAEGYFVVMELVRGDNLEELRLRRGGKLPFAEVKEIALQLFDILDYLHTQEIPVIHKDIKPANLKLTPRGQLKLLDFGLAKGSVGMMTTQKSSILKGGTPAYEPPEQGEGRSTDPRSDLFSAAATLYHLATGIRPPSSLTERVLPVALGRPDPLRLAHELSDDIPRQFAEILHSALSIAAEKRPASAAKTLELLKKAEKPQASRKTNPTVAQTKKSVSKQVEKTKTSPPKSPITEKNYVDIQTTPSMFEQAKKDLAEAEQKRLEAQKLTELEKKWESERKRKESNKIQIEIPATQYVEVQKSQVAEKTPQIPSLPESNRRPGIFNKVIDWLDAEKTGGYFAQAVEQAENKDFNAAILSYNKAIELNPHHALSYNNRGQVYFNTGRFDEAYADFNKALELNPHCVEAYFNKGVWYSRKKFHAPAIFNYSKAIELRPSFAAAYNNRGLIYLDKKQINEAFNDFNQAVKCDSKYNLAYHNRGKIYHDSGRYKEAIQDYTRAIELNPDFVTTYQNRALAYEKIGDFASAKNDRLQAERLERNK